uniref:Forkhead box protein I1-B-like n=1 Tax=Saccoglossus kowalevskii TaxID=10224 RepID=A0ABM0N0Z9_SACKO
MTMHTPRGNLMYAADVYSRTQHMYANPPYTSIFNSHSTLSCIDRPPYSFVALIVLAIRSYAKQRATLKDIYRYIETTFPYYRGTSPGWKNSIRHNLSLNNCFIKSPRSIHDLTHGHFWRLAEGWKEMFAESDFRRRRRGYKKSNNHEFITTNSQANEDYITRYKPESTPSSVEPCKKQTPNYVSSITHSERTQEGHVNGKQFSDFSIAKILRCQSKRKAGHCDVLDNKRIKRVGRIVSNVTQDSARDIPGQSFN